jgi:hypothetical protein
MLRKLFALLSILLFAACSSLPQSANVEPEQPSAFPELPIDLETCVVQPSIGGFPRFARLMHDPQWMPWPSRIADPDWPSGFHFDRYPETVQLFSGPRGGAGRFAYPKPWLEFLRDLQPNDEAAVWIARIAAGLFNRGNADIPILDLDSLQSEPIAESISSGGNVVRLLETRNGSGRLEMLYFRDDPPDLTAVNYEKTPWLITKFTSVAIDGEIGLAGGIDVYFPNLAKQEDGYWVDMQRVEPFPMLPMCVIADGQVKLYEQPNTSATSVATLDEGQSLALREYLPQGSDVWARTDYGWLRLLYQVDSQPVYPTSWEMDTRPPAVFD